MFRTDEKETDEILIETLEPKEDKRIIRASIDGEPIGHISFTLGFKGNSNELDVETIGVNEMHQRRGIARLMFEYLLANYGEFNINSGASNDEARLLQEGMGFKLIAPYRLKREGSNLGNKSLKDIKPEIAKYKLPKIMIKINNYEDIEKLYQLCKGDLKLLQIRLEQVLSNVLDEVNGYKKTDYSNLYNMINRFVQEKTSLSKVEDEISYSNLNEEKESLGK